MTRCIYFDNTHAHNKSPISLGRSNEILRISVRHESWTAVKHRGSVFLRTSHFPVLATQPGGEGKSAV